MNRGYTECGKEIGNPFGGNLRCVLGVDHYGDHQDKDGPSWADPGDNFMCTATLRATRPGQNHMRCVLDRDHGNHHRSEMGHHWYHGGF